MKTSRLIDLVDVYEGQLIELRRKIHQEAELSSEEYRTSSLVEGYLGQLDIESKRLAKTGIMGIIRGEKPGKTLLLRAEMDALPLEEKTGLSFSSRTGAMHACGHDVHTASLLIVARVLRELKHYWQGTVKLIFQPAEERGGGARRMMEEGILENPTPDLALALHVLAIEGGAYPPFGGASWPPPRVFS